MITFFCFGFFCTQRGTGCVRNRNLPFTISAARNLKINITGNIYLNNITLLKYRAMLSTVITISILSTHQDSKNTIINVGFTVCVSRHNTSVRQIKEIVLSFFRGCYFICIRPRSNEQPSECQKNFVFHTIYCFIN